MNNMTSSPVRQPLHPDGADELVLSEYFAYALLEDSTYVGRYTCPGCGVPEPDLHCHHGSVLECPCGLLGQVYGNSIYVWVHIVAPLAVLRMAVR